MTISTTLSNALSGLTANSRAAELVSANVANARTPGYGTRELELASRYIGGGPSGVNVVGVRREVDEPVLQGRRLADASVGYGETTSRFHTDLENILGTPDSAHSLTSRLANFESALVEASSRPDNEARLSAVFNASESLTDFLNQASEQVQGLRMQADQSIQAQVDQLNSGLRRVQNLNYEIRESLARGQDPSPLMDLRDQTIDGISSIVPMKLVPRENGMVALFTPGGAILLDSKAAELSYSAVGTIVPEMTQDSGALSGLELNGNALRTNGNRSHIAGGSLSALFEIRDELATEAQSRLDGVALDLINRFADPSIDATRNAGNPGLFTDAGGAFSPGNEVALSERIKINALVDPNQGGALWRIRDGLGATTQGPVGNSQLISDLAGAMNAQRPPSFGAFLGVNRTAHGLASELLSTAATARTNSEELTTFAVAEQDGLTLMQKESGVDTDHEMQKLLLIEQSYAANARVIQTVSEMLDSVMRIG